MAARILVVEDDRMLAKIIGDNLTLDGFEVARAADANSALNLVRRFVPDLILLDVMLPDRSGFDIFASLSRGGRTPIIFLTARGQRADKVRGLNLGGDDYITKPFDLEELLARVHAVLRRVRADLEQVKLGPVVVDFSTQTAAKGGKSLHLTHQEFQLLKYLASRAGKVVYRTELLRAVWGYPDDSANTRSVDHAIARLRKKLERDPEEPKFIHTVHGDGYMLTPDSSQVITVPSEGKP
jgi:DNA-binding response OmpR family regulator